MHGTFELLGKKRALSCSPCVGIAVCFLCVVSALWHLPHKTLLSPTKLEHLLRNEWIFHNIYLLPIFLICEGNTRSSNLSRNFAILAAILLSQEVKMLLVYYAGSNKYQCYISNFRAVYTLLLITTVLVALQDFYNSM